MSKEMPYEEFKPMSDFIFEQIRAIPSAESDDSLTISEDLDTINLKKALLFCDSILSADIIPYSEFEGNREEFNRKMRLFHFGYKSQILSALGQYAEAFIEYGKSVELYTNDLDRYLYYGMKYSMLDKKDSSDYYFSKVINEFDKSKEYNLDLVAKRIQIFYWLEQKENFNRCIGSLSVKYPEHREELMGFKNEHMFLAWALTKDFREKIINDDLKGKLAK